MKEASAISFSEHLNRELGFFRFSVPIFGSLLAGMASCLGLLFFYADSDRFFLQTIAPHISTLVETQDRPELQRFLASVAREKGAGLKVLQGDKIIASTDDLSLIGRTYQVPERLVVFGKGFLTSSHLLNEVPIMRPNGPITDARLILTTPLQSIIIIGTFVATISFLVFFCFARVLAVAMLSKAQSAISPIEDLDKAVSDLQNFSSFDPPPLFQIEELDRIRKTIIETHANLEAANEALAESKATERLAEAYRRLLHDLQTPIASLRNWTKIANDPQQEGGVRTEGHSRIIHLSEQIMTQIAAARTNLDLKIEIQPSLDIRQCILQATENAKVALEDRKVVNLRHSMPESPIAVPHDPVMLSRAISNLVANAIEACKESVEVVVSQSDDRVQIAISDDGQGLEPDKVSLFLQGRGKSTKANRNGIGLSSANHIVNAHGGKLIYSLSALGGACFQIRMQRV